MSKFAIWIGAWINIASSVVTILTLGRVVPSWELHYCAWVVLRGVKKMNTKTLKDFPHVLDEIRKRWGVPELLEAYIAKIGIMDRDFREGFPPAAFSDLMKVLTTHELLFGASRQSKLHTSFMTYTSTRQL